MENLRQKSIPIRPSRRAGILQRIAVTFSGASKALTMRNMPPLAVTLRIEIMTNMLSLQNAIFEGLCLAASAKP